MKTQAETELAKEKSEVEELSRVLEEKERTFEEINHAFEQFQQRYSSEVSQKYVELNRLNAELAELMVKNIPYNQVKQKSSKIETPVENSAEPFNDVSIGEQPESHSIKELKEVKKIYRRIASVIHPDKGADVGSRPLRTKMMVELNEAYARKDTIAMQRIFDQWKESPEAVTGDDTHADLERIRRMIIQIKKRILEIETKISKIMTSEMYTMMMNARKANREGRDILAEMTIAIDARIKDAQNKLVLRMYG